MEYAIISAAFGLCFFIVPLWAYRRGLKDGLALNKGQSIAPIQSPVAVVQKAVDDRKQANQSKAQEDSLTKGLANIMAYDGTPQKEGEK